MRLHYIYKLIDRIFFNMKTTNPRPLDDGKGYGQRYFNFVTEKSELFKNVVDFIYIGDVIV